MAEEQAEIEISVIVPVYNDEPYLARCLDSIRAQTFKGWECICVDDGSTDKSAAMLDEYAMADSRFVVIHKENEGTCVARNVAIEKARGTYITFVDHDDWIESETYELAIAAARRADADIVQWGYVSEFSAKTVYSKKLKEGFFDVFENTKYYGWEVWTKLFRRSLVLENQIGFPTNAKRVIYEDVYFSSIAFAAAKKCFYLDRTLYHWDCSHDSLSKRKATLDDIKAIVDATEQLCDRVSAIAGLEKDRKTERQKDRKTERQKDRKTERQCLLYAHAA